jgi:hypothetical protein
MKTPFKTLAPVAFLAILSLSTGAAQAEGRGCLVDQLAPSAKQAAPGADLSKNEMNKIDAALNAGQITPYEAGRLMRQQWELAQFQRGFLEGAPAPRNNVAAGGGGCGLGMSGSDLGDMAGNVAGTMARNGIQTATKVMRALMRETEKLIQEQAAEENAF